MSTSAKSNSCPATKLSSSSKPKSTAQVSKIAKLRTNITPGTVLILLSGRFRGRRVVFLKQLSSGLLLVTGPYKFNGVPLKRVNQAYVISTSTKVDIKDIQLDDNVNDEFFKKVSASKSSTLLAKATTFFAKDSDKKVLSSARKNAQVSVDNQLIPVIKKTPLLRSYIGSRFALKKGQAPHSMKF